MNPYAKQLGNRDPFKVIAETATQLESLAKRIGPANLEKPRAPGKWSARQILCHLADCEIAFGFRLRQTLAEEGHVIQPFDQDKWAKSYAAYDTQGAVDLFTSLRAWNVKLVSKASQKELDKKVVHPERGEETFRTIIETMGGHDLNHLQQLEEIASKVAS